MERVEDRACLAGFDGIFSQIDLEQEWPVRASSETNECLAWLPNLVLTRSTSPPTSRREVTVAASEADRPGRVVPPRRLRPVMQ
eukprot:8339714-Lingulodinium_polyedra.AAC.1